MIFSQYPILRQNMIDYILYYCPEGGEIMDFNELLKLTAEEYGTTPSEVEKEMKEAINSY